MWNENHFSEQGLQQEDNAQVLLNLVPAMIVKGAEQIPSELLTKIFGDITDIQAVQTPLCRMDNRFYFQRYWFYETFFLHHYRQFTSKTPYITFDVDKIYTQVKLLEHSKKLLPEQANAILNACKYTLTIISGGPGTGKTHTAGVLICTIWDALDDIQRDNFQIALAAPTGKAAANLQKSLLRATEGIGQLANLQSKTLHALLGIKGSSIPDETKFLPHDLVIVDESSMVDVRLMAALFAAIKPGARLILLGDGHQLPSVEAGSVFADFVRCESDGNTSSAAVPVLTGTAASRVTSLHKCLRAELKGILDVATAINQGKTEDVVHLFEQGLDGLERLNIQANSKSDAAIAREICSYALECYQMQNLDRLQPKELLNHFNSFRLLSPLRKGAFGVEEINRSINQKVKTAFLAKETSSVYVAPIMLLKNDYRLELFNGEVGVLVRPLFKEGVGDFDFSCGDYAIFIGKDGEIKKVPALLLPSFEFAYCLSVHKSQGSEFDHLLLLLPSGSECFGRELLYTAVTRTRRKLTLWAEDEILNAAIQRTNHRLSGIPARKL
jgi:exodeoxyribonuclease V alpha subunit